MCRPSHPWLNPTALHLTALYPTAKSAYSIIRGGMSRAQTPLPTHVPLWHPSTMRGRCTTAGNTPHISCLFWQATSIHQLCRRDPACTSKASEYLCSLIELNRVPLRRALISVYDKTGLEEFARGLHEAGVALVSTGSTASTIAAAGVPSPRSPKSPVSPSASKAA